MGKAVWNALWGSSSQHYVTEQSVVDRAFAFYGQWPAIDPATNAHSLLRASTEYGLPYDVDHESLALEKRLKRALTDAEWLRLEDKARSVDAAARKRGIILADSLLVDWSVHYSGWLNPPYDDVEPFMDKVRTNTQGDWLVLIASRTSAQWFQRCVFGHANSVLFFDRRLRFMLDGQRTSSAPFDSALAMYSTSTTGRARFADAFAGCGKIIDLK